MNIVKNRMAQRGQGGFTLIELLVVIAILAILAGVVVFAVGNSTKNAEVAGCKTERASIITGWQAAKASNLVNGPSSQETYTNYLSTTPKYFDNISAGGATRINVTNADAASCAVLTSADLG